MILIDGAPYIVAITVRDDTKSFSGFINKFTYQFDGAAASPFFQTNCCLEEVMQEEMVGFIFVATESCNLTSGTTVAKQAHTEIIWTWWFNLQGLDHNLMKYKVIAD